MYIAFSKTLLMPSSSSSSYSVCSSKNYHMLSMLFLLLLFESAPFFAQEIVPREYQTVAYQKMLLEENPGLRQVIKQQEQKISRTLHRSDSLGKIVIPVYFHLLSSTGLEVITASSVRAQLDALNRDFNDLDLANRTETDIREGFSERAAIMGLNFCLADTPDDGITRKTNSLLLEGINQAIKEDRLGGSSAVRPQQFINIWVVDLPEGVAGYAQMPGGHWDTDGIVIGRNFFGLRTDTERPYGEGKTLTHLVGNYLGLYDIWGETPCEDDYVSDTPLHNAPNWGCENGPRHISLCSEHPIEMTMNFMDNSYDACTYLFTEGQKNRVMAMLSSGGPRHHLTRGRSWCSNDFSGDYPLPESASVDKKFVASGNIVLLPNPASNYLQLQLHDIQSEQIEMQIYDISGKKMLARQITSNGFRAETVDLRNWPSGIYLLSLRYEDKTISKKFVIH